MTEQTNQAQGIESQTGGTQSTPSGSDQTPVSNLNENGDIQFSPDDFSSSKDDTDDLDESNTDETSKPNQSVGEFKIKYNGKEEVLTREQIIELAQKGRNYDHVFQEKEALKQYESALRELANEAGLPDAKTFVDALRKNTMEAKVERRALELEGQGYGKKQARYVAELELKANAQATQSTPPKEGPGSPDATKDFSDLLEAYPETRNFQSLNEYPQEFLDMLKDGTKPVVAYAKYLTAKAEAEKALAEQNAKAKLKDSGSLQSHEGDNKKDAFRDALFGS